MNQWHLYDDDDVFPNVVEGTGLAKYARMLLYEYVSKEDYESFVNSTETVVKKWDCFVAKAHKIAELMYFLQKSENDFLGGFTKFKQNIREAIEVEYLNKKDHPQFFSNETGEINTYGHNAAHALTEACLDGYKEDGVWKGFLEEASEKFFGIVKQACVRAGSFPVEKSDWVDFFSEKVYPDLLKDVFSKEHEEQNKYIQFDVILEILEKAQQTEKVIVIEEDQGFNHMDIFEEGNKATANANVSEEDFFTTLATKITMSVNKTREDNSQTQVVPTIEIVVDEHLTTGASITADPNQPSVPTVTTNVHIADAGQILGSVRAFGSIFGGSPKKPPTMALPKDVTIATDTLVATAGPDSQENETLGSTDTLVADLISGIQTIAADGKVELLKKLLNDLKSSTGSM